MAERLRDVADILALLLPSYLLPGAAHLSNFRDACVERAEIVICPSRSLLKRRAVRETAADVLAYVRLLSTSAWLREALLPTLDALPEALARAGAARALAAVIFAEGAATAGLAERLASRRPRLSLAHLAVASGCARTVHVAAQACRRAGLLDMPDDSGETPLLKAVLLGNARAVDELLRARAAPNWTGAATPTPLLAACALRREDLVRALLESGADPNAACAEPEANVPLSAAVLGYLPTLSINGHERQAPPIVEALLDARARVDDAHGLSRTPLFLACRNGMSLTAALLLAARADPEAVDACGDSVLEVARIAGHSCLVDLLVDATRRLRG
jgi:hypothetical protein